MTAADVDAAAAIQAAAFADLARRSGEEYDPPSPERTAQFAAALARFTEVDAPGCWVADQDGRPVGYAVAIRRGSLWGLANLLVHPDAQERGTGRTLVEHALDFARDADVRIVLASQDPRATRRYAALGLALHPAVSFAGTVDRATLPRDTVGRDGSADDLDLVDEVDRRLRAGSSRAADVRHVLDGGARLHVVDGRDGRGWLATGEAGAPLMLGADDVATARRLLVRGLAHSDPGGEITVRFVTAEQGWAVEPCLAAGLRIRACGPVFLGGWPRPPGPWLPSGIYF